MFSRSFFATKINDIVRIFVFYFSSPFIIVIVIFCVTCSVVKIQMIDWKWNVSNSDNPHGQAEGVWKANKGDVEQAPNGSAAAGGSTGRWPH